MSVLSKITTFVNAAILYIRSFFLRSFLRHPARLAAPYPLAPDLENCVIEISRGKPSSVSHRPFHLIYCILDDSHFVEKGMDLEMGMFSGKDSLYEVDEVADVP
jgi:hypothetical protein